jgi:hypothetical protein
MYLINVTSPAVSTPWNMPIAAPVASGTGANSALGTPAFAHVGIDARVRDAKQAAPPRGELR